MLLIILFCLSADARAQATDDFSAYMGYRGYSVYQQMGRDGEATAANAYRDSRLPQPLLSSPRGHRPRPVLREGEYRLSETDKDEPSRIEAFYRDRTGEEGLRQFGYDMLYTQAEGVSYANPSLQTIPTGAVQDSYILQAGDEISVIFQGERKDRETYRVESDGRVIIDGLAPVMAMGRSLGQVRADIHNALQAAQYYGGADVTVSAVRQIGVLVAGHIHKPGRHTMNAYHSVLDALTMAGGIRRSGTLRNIKLIRNGSANYIDLYPYFTFGSLVTQEKFLQDGDRIIVPPLGGTFAMTGEVRQAGIYELKSLRNQPQSVYLREALAIAGGTMGQGDYAFTLQTGRGDIVNMKPGSSMAITDGSVIDVIRATDRLTNGVELKGYSRGNGFYDLQQAGTLQDLLGDGRLFGDDTYPLIGVISRVNRGKLTRHMMAFSPQAIIKKQDDRQLEAGDIVYLFSHQNIIDINNENSDKNNFSKVISEFVRDHAVRVSGAVRQEGEWPVGTVGNLKTLIAVAGGLTSQANEADIEIISRDNGFEAEQKRLDLSSLTLADWSDIALEAGDVVRVNERFEMAAGGSVQITGEVRNPGTYDLMRGEAMLSLIERAGGLTPEAYPPAAVFSRQSERKREEQKFRAAAHELERTVSVALNGDGQGKSLSPAQIAMARQLAEDLRSVQAVGRVTVEADPAVLSVKPELNMLLDDGDHLHIPKRSLNVRVSGEVMNPASLLFDEDKDAADYIRQAGGTSYYADKGRSFVVYPDGSAEPLDSGWSLSGGAMIIPGSTIVVPRDPKPFDFMESFKDITQIMTNMAITGVFIEDIANDEN